MNDDVAATVIEALVDGSLSLTMAHMENARAAIKKAGGA